MKAKIRIEPFGSLIYFQDTATTIELDIDETRDILNYKGEFPKSEKGIMSPKIVHLELTSRCDMDPLCDYCYATGDPTTDLSTIQWKNIIRDLGKSGVLQVTFGGGEPTLREDLFSLAKYVKTKAKMNLGMTTNGLNIEPDKQYKLFDQINLSIHNNWDFVRWKAIILKNYTKVGFNFVCRQDNMSQLDDIYTFIKWQNEMKSRWQKDMELLLLSYKPVIGDTEQIVSNDTILSRGNKMAEDIPVAVDGYTCNQCEGGFSFVDVSSKGELYPCSFIREPVGNLLEKRLLTLWKEVPTITECPYGED